MRHWNYPRRDCMRPVSRFGRGTRGIPQDIGPCERDLMFEITTAATLPLRSGGSGSARSDETMGASRIHRTWANTIEAVRDTPRVTRPSTLRVDPRLRRTSPASGGRVTAPTALQIPQNPPSEMEDSAPLKPRFTKPFQQSAVGNPARSIPHPHTPTHTARATPARRAVAMFNDAGMV